ncbi:hypothetical protein F4779DRAFT_233856 [Xylariaceae sp. FL0662B]|nr:hypothetical protein F4779DRAFT_233856 [Xylariaceae sp. FL0662B]
MSQAKDVEAAIRFQHGIIRAQFANSNLRYSTKWETNNALPDLFPPSDERNNDVIYDAQLEIPKAQFCIIQDATATRILESLLGAVAALILVAKLFEARTDIVPQRRSIASVLALIAGGNLFQFLRENGAETEEDIAESDKAIYICTTAADTSTNASETRVY